MAEINVSGKWTKEPVDRRIFGNFIESGFGRQVNGMWSEMLYNRAFREVAPYKIATWEWLGLDMEHYGSDAPFWHSGYEEYDWQLIGTPSKEYSCGTHTYKGMTSLLLRNEADGECGLKQDGIHLKEGKTYTFRLFTGIRGDISEAGLNGFGDTQHSEEAKELTVRVGKQKKSFRLTTVPCLHTWEFEAEEEGAVSLQLTFTFKGSLLLSFASLMPSDHVGGWRPEVIERLKEAAPSVVRFPGGCFVSFYDWEASVGDRDRREPQPSFYWGGLEENDVGLDEFLHLSQLVGFQPQICFNMMTSQPFKARQLVEYLNAPADTGMGRLRMLNGHEQPYGVKLFEMDNEPGRKWTAQQYARACVEYASEMRLADPSVELMMAAYAYPPQLLSEMLSIAGKDIQYVIYRQGDPEFVHAILPVIREYNRVNNTSLRLVNTEWLPSCRSMEPFENPEMPVDFRWHGEITNDYSNIFGVQQISWNYALNGAHRLLDYMSYGGEFALANFNNMCNTWGQNIIEASKEECYLSCMGRVFSMFAAVFEPCRATLADTGDDRLFALAAETVSGREQLYLINHSGSELETVLPEGRWRITDGLTGSGRMVHETRSSSCVTRLKEQEVNGSGCMIPALSIICMERTPSDDAGSFGNT